MMTKLNFGYDPLTLRGKTCDNMRISIELDDPYDGISMKVVENLAEKLYSTFHVDSVALYRDDVCICMIEKKEEEGE